VAVEEVQHLKSELQGHPFTNGESLDQGRVFAEGCQQADLREPVRRRPQRLRSSIGKCTRIEKAIAWIGGDVHSCDGDRLDDRPSLVANDARQGGSADLAENRRRVAAIGIKIR